MARRRGRRRPMADINVVPYIDVMLVLLVIFMITAPLLKTGVEVNLPRAEAKPLQKSDAEPLVATVDADGRYYLNVGGDTDKPVAAKRLVTLATAALRRNPERRVLVRGDRGVDYQKVVQAMTLLQRAGAEQVQLVAEQG